MNEHTDNRRPADPPRGPAPLGVIADDFTGATDVAVALRRAGLRTLLFFGVPNGPDEADDGAHGPHPARLPEHDALVIALKSRMIPAADAVASSTGALEWLRGQGAGQIYFKFCSTFDSTPRGNIGPVLDRLAEATGAGTVPLTPSSPEHLRTQYQGCLFVDDVLLGESHMRDHPVTPMTDSYLPRVLRAQTREQVTLIGLATVRQGEAAVRAALTGAAARGTRYVLADGIDESDLRTLGRAVLDAPLVAGAAGLAAGLAHAHAEQRGLTPDTWRDETDPARKAASEAPGGPAAVLSGSCSRRTLEQLAALADAGRPAYRLDPVAAPDPVVLADAALTWYDTLPAGGSAPVLYSSATPDRLREVQRVLGVEQSAAVLEEATGLIAAGLVERGVRRLVAAGGETSGAVVAALGITGAHVGAEAARGVPWIHPLGDRPPALLLKSGNFGGSHLLLDASASPAEPADRT
ncbi:3-oxo-tetronate kinase [Streptomyces subrutilus]|uniref:3-oxo-tetronate kinase n=1 Tax=Streptomyces subrutilus TaxID=36818 RepID=A0A5P2V0K1_9ACTN|nr:3-oxo-tetronate kinase [Streptomyces subrutilus]QEU82577.1 four-carbon acid sugar kinase family protein [Streptomyces subrutilus]WSJ27943.1 four-carbon acid sugar kinase family protein [Streptomyces subrutilus]GGZ82254.1 HPr kinase [Streptomyces subrutilus]